MSDQAARANALLRQLLNLVEEEAAAARSDEQIEKRKFLLRAQEDLESVQRNLMKALRDA